MESLSSLIKETFPNYLRDLPVPNSFSGIFRLGVFDWFRLTPLLAIVGGSSYMTWLYIKDEVSQTEKRSKVNLNLKKEQDKVVDTVDIEDIGDKKVYCRCWRSKIFPLCDGSHNKHNEITGDNVGPLIVKKK